MFWRGEVTFSFISASTCNHWCWLSEKFRMDVMAGSALPSFPHALRQSWTWSHSFCTSSMTSVQPAHRSFFSHALCSRGQRASSRVLFVLGSHGLEISRPRSSNRRRNRSSTVGLGRRD
jgi:hypothetical protein